MRKLSCAFIALALAAALCPALASAAPNNSGYPACTPKVLPYSATAYPRVVMYGDSITQHGHNSGVSPTVSTYNPSVTASVTTAIGSNIVVYNGTDLATLALYPVQAITGTGIPTSTTIAQVTDATHFRINANATASGTITATFASPLNGAQAAWTINTSNLGEMVNAQALYPYFRFEQWNDPTRNFGAVGNFAPFMRGGDMGYSGGSTTDLINHEREVMALNPDILVIAIGVNNITSATFANDMSNLVDTFHAWCPSLPIVLSNIRATQLTQAVARPTGGIVYDNSLIAGIVAARPWLKTVDLFTPFANINTSGGTLVENGVTISNGSATATIPGLNGSDARQVGVRVGQSVTGTGIQAATTVSAVAGSTVTLSLTATTGPSSNLTFSPFYGVSGALDTGNANNYNVSYPGTFVGDGLHPGFYGAWLTVPNLSAAVCQFITGACTISATHNVLIDNPGLSMLSASPASLLTGTTAAVYHLGTGLLSANGTWSTAGTTLVTTSVPGTNEFVGACISATGIASGTVISGVSYNSGTNQTTVTFSPAATAAGTSSAVSFGTCNNWNALTGTWTAPSTSVTLNASALGIYQGMCVSGTGLGTNSYVAAISGTALTVAPATVSSGTAAALSFAPCVHGTGAAGMDVALGSVGYLTSYSVAVAANPETTGNMMQIVAYPNGSNASEKFVIRPSGIAIASTLCAGKWCQMWGEFEVDQGSDWLYIVTGAYERLATYSNNYFAQASHAILPLGSGTRRIWAHTECFAYPYNSSGSTPSFTVALAPSLGSAAQQINLRRWDIRQCVPPQSLWKAK